MANPHHRPKHKEYVHQKHQSTQHHALPAKTSKKASLPLAITGAVAGFLVGYIANRDSITVLIISCAIGAIGGYLFGKSIDNTLEKKK
ncbi:hypothetical protein BH10BAC2_BH10BAC2_29410 [soil metagenome]